ncbi:glycosyltransferase family 2 protein [Porphyromonas uenonis]|uniref:glycosyltransferase family 2 protein n=1 Tax=Porphyromonas uenonis TaxID=281920 RepID=UPI0026EBBEFA|nr:glycosyltransferase family 2 protein [Porphyromonas uenonis]
MEQIIEDFFRTPSQPRVETDKRLYLIDNSPTDEMRYLAELPVGKGRIYYEHQPSNLGFGKAHNIAIRLAHSEGARYHVIINPDVRFDETVLDTLTAYMEEHEEVGLVSPFVYYPDGRPQQLCKLLPRPCDVLLRRFSFSQWVRDKVNKRYEMHWLDYSKPVEVPYLSGCFMFTRMETLERVGGFDERFFMYVEDTDLSRRIGQVSKTICHPEAKITHVHSRGSYHDAKLLWHHISSMVKYFNKWGWWCDAERKEVNARYIPKEAKL